MAIENARAMIFVHGRSPLSRRLTWALDTPIRRATSAWLSPLLLSSSRRPVATVIDTVIASPIVDGGHDAVNRLLVNLREKYLTAAIPPFTLSIVMGIPQWLREIYEKGKREGRWSSIEDMARDSGLRTSTLFRWMSDQRRPDIISCLKLAHAFKKDAKDVLRMAGHDVDSLDTLLKPATA